MVYFLISVTSFPVRYLLESGNFKYFLWKLQGDFTDLSEISVSDEVHRQGHQPSNLKFRCRTSQITYMKKKLVQSCTEFKQSFLISIRTR